MSTAHQTRSIDLRQCAGADPAVQQGRILGNIGVALHMGQNGSIPTVLHRKQGILNSTGMDAGRKFNQDIPRPCKCQFGKIQAGQSCGKIDLCTQFNGKRKFAFCQLRHNAAISHFALLNKSIQRNALIMEMRCEHNANNPVFHFFLDQGHGNIQVFGTVINARQNMTMEINQLRTHYALLRLFFPAASSLLYP